MRCILMRKSHPRVHAGYTHTIIGLHDEHIEVGGVGGVGGVGCKVHVQEGTSRALLNSCIASLSLPCCCRTCEKVTIVLAVRSDDGAPCG